MYKSIHLKGISMKHPYMTCMLESQIDMFTSNITSDFNVIFANIFSDSVVNRNGMDGWGLHWVLPSLLLYYQAYDDISARSSHDITHSY